MAIDPATLDLERLFRDRNMFDSAADWRGAGFEILRNSENKIVVASHLAVAGYLFKKYVNAGKRQDPLDQLANYTRRIDGANRLRALVEERHLRHIAAPRKWLRELPPRFDVRGQRSHVLVVERLELLTEHTTAQRYGHIDEDALSDLCTVLHAFRGLDSTLKNMPFTAHGAVAFVDTEHWDRRSDRPWLKYLREHLTRDRWTFAERMRKQLAGG